MSGVTNRREFLWLSALGLVSAGCSKAVPPQADPRAVLAAAAAVLVPTEGITGAQQPWAEAFLERRWKSHPEEVSLWNAAAHRLESQARQGHGAAFATLPMDRREEVFRAVHPSLADEPTLTPDVRAERGLLRALMLAFFVSDHLSLEEAAVFSGNPRDVSQPSTSEYEAARPFPDIHFDRMYAMAVATGGGSMRAWALAGYDTFPGSCKRSEDYVGLPRRIQP